MAQNFHELPPTKRFKILNSEQITQPLNGFNKNNQKSLPAKKRAQNLNISSTSSCLPAKKRVWALNPVSPTKSETQARDPDPLVEEKGRSKEGESSSRSGIPLKKRVWARRLLSPIKSESKPQSQFQSMLMKANPKSVTKQIKYPQRSGSCWRTRYLKNSRKLEI